MTEDGAATLMAGEIRQIPRQVAAQLAEAGAEVDRAARLIRHAAPRWCLMVGRGTSDHAALYGRYLLEAHLGLPVAMAAPSLTTVYGVTLDWTDALVIAVSQSGRSPDLVAVIEAARAAGAASIVITNDPASPLAEAGEVVIGCRAGEERAVAATKTYVAGLVGLADLAARLRPHSPLAGGLARLPDVLDRCLDRSERWLQRAPAADAFAGAERALVTSRGYNMATACEVALKLKEAGGIFAEGYSTADLLHGPIALAGPGTPLLAFRPDGRMGAHIDDVVGRAEAAGSTAWVIGGREAEPMAAVNGSFALALPLDLPEALTPMAFALPGQLIAEAVARTRDRDPDSPAGLTKVTLTR